MFSKIALVFKIIKNYPTFILDFLGLIGGKEVIYETRNNLKFFTRVNTSDKSEVAIVCSGSEYPKEYFPKRKNLTVVDIGAHIGTFTAYLSRTLYAHNPLVYAIEPAKSNFSYLVRNMKLNSFDSVKCFNLAIGDKDSVGYIDMTKDNDGFTVSTEDIEKKEKKDSFEKCKVLTLESFCQSQNIRKIDLLKIDCEGCEYGIFEKSLEFIKNNVKYIFAEVHDLDDKNNIRTFKKLILTNKFSIETEIMERTLFLKNLNI